MRLSAPAGTWCLVAGIIALVPVANTVAATVTMVAELRGGQEVPPVPTAALGSGRFVIDTTAKTITYHVSFTGLSSTETAAHIHGFSDPGVNSGILFNLGTGNPKTGVVSYTAAQEPGILAGRTYVNIHTTNFPGGEIRGQINSFAMAMDGAQENPPSGTSGRGWGTFNVNTCSNELRYYIMVESLSTTETAAHIHGLALPGTNAGILHDLGTGNLKTGTWIYPESLETAILNGLTYVNVHTTSHPGGEIRGQIVNTVVPIDGAQETPPISSPAAGNGFIAFNQSTNTLGYYFTFANLTSPETAAHIHGYAPPGVPAGVVHDLGTGNPKKGTWTYGAANAANVLGGLTYINIHTSNFPPGEIRGQIIRAQPKCTADVNCDLVVNVNDLLAVINAWGPCSGGPLCPTDINYDGFTNVNDLLGVINGWGPCP